MTFNMQPKKYKIYAYIYIHIYTYIHTENKSLILNGEVLVHNLCPASQALTSNLDS